MKPVIKLLQEELGDTIPPITDCLFVWLCTFFPDEDNWLDEEHKLSFKDTVRNEKPTLGSVQSAIDLFHQNFQPEIKLQNDDEHESNHFKMIVETIHLLARRSETVLLEKLERDTATLCETARHFEFKSSPNQLLLDLFLRTSLEAGNYSPGSTVHQFVESSISFRCLGGKVVKLWGGMHGDISVRYPIWNRLELKFTLPDGKELKLDTGFVDYMRSKKRPLLTEQLSPVTELLQECTNQSMQGEKHIPRIDNLFTATYFLHVLGFSRPGKFFLRMYGN
ncbi:hypothetical protein OS493_032805 [Desmophyllum pertusum]|uniref:Uncharacterized protein n=1 Tax=Desmophyllum pertusum TaxID=174260 RepID=A0A9W9Z834_9CNID|nr:hypothetical protein OS493_032805 [Desmophyllum pertusum]